MQLELIKLLRTYVPDLDVNANVVAQEEERNRALMGRWQAAIVGGRLLNAQGETAKHKWVITVEEWPVHGPGGERGRC